jgi:hypothetical protein
MRRVNFGRPSPAMIVACLALFAALGGSAYAALKIDTDEIKSEAVTSPKIAKRTIKGNRVAGDTLKGNKIQEDTLGTVPEARDADAVDGKHADCDGGRILFIGECWDNAPRAAQTWIPAARTCTSEGGRLPSADELRGFQQAGNTLAGTSEYTNDITEVPSEDTAHVVIVSNAGSLNFTNGATDPKGFHCVFPLVH